MYISNSLSYLWRWEKKVIQTNLTNIIKEKQDNIRGIQFEHLIKDFKKAPIVVVVRRAHLFMKDIADY